VSEPTQPSPCQTHLRGLSPSSCRLPPKPKLLLRHSNGFPGEGCCFTVTVPLTPAPW